MRPKFITFLNRNLGSLNQAALLLGFFSLLSQVFGLLRDHLLASLVGPSSTLDIYYAAFRVPDFLYNSFATLFSVTVLIPFIVEYLEKRKNGEESRFRHFIDSVFTTYTIGMLIVCAVVFVCMPGLAHLTAPGFSGAQLHTLVFFSRTMLLSPFLFGLSNLFTSFAQVQRKFLSFAIAPVIYNFGILIGVVVFRVWWGMYGVVIGVVVGAAFYMLLQVPALVELKSIPRLIKSIDIKLIGRITKLSLPRTLASALSNITFIVMSAFASILAIGSVSIFQFAYNIQTTPLMIIGISYATAAFPTLSKLFAEKSTAAFSKLVESATRSILFFSLPAITLFIVLRAQIVRILLGAGVFSWNDTRLVAACLACFAISIAAQGVILLFIRAFFATGNTKTPLAIGVLGTVVTAICGAAFLILFSRNDAVRLHVAGLLRIGDLRQVGVIALPLAFSIGQITSALLLWRALARRKLAATVMIWKPTLQYLGASILAAVASYGVLAVAGSSVQDERFIGVLIEGVLAGVVGIVVYSILLYWVKNPELLQFFNSIHSKLYKPKTMPIVPEQLEF